MGKMDYHCQKDKCEWYVKEEGRCAIALLPSVLDWLVRFALTEPYETEGGQYEDCC